MDPDEQRRRAIELASRRLAAAAFGGPEWDAAQEALEELTRRTMGDGPTEQGDASHPGRGGYATMLSIDDRT